MRIISIIVHDRIAGPACVPKILAHLGKSTEFPAQWPARQHERGPPGTQEMAASQPGSEDHWLVDEAPSTDDYFTDPVYEESGVDADERNTKIPGCG